MILIGKTITITVDVSQERLESMEPGQREAKIWLITDIVNDCIGAAVNKIVEHDPELSVNVEYGESQ